jgi:hypothetical protein
MPNKAEVVPASPILRNSLLFMASNSFPSLMAHTPSSWRKALDRFLRGSGIFFFLPVYQLIRLKNAATSFYCIIFTFTANAAY